MKQARRQEKQATTGNTVELHVKRGDLSRNGWMLTGWSPSYRSCGLECCQAGASYKVTPID